MVGEAGQAGIRTKLLNFEKPIGKLNKLHAGEPIRAIPIRDGVAYGPEAREISQNRVVAPVPREDCCVHPVPAVKRVVAAAAFKGVVTREAFEHVGRTATAHDVVKARGVDVLDGDEGVEAAGAVAGGAGL